MYKYYLKYEIMKISQSLFFHLFVILTDYTLISPFIKVQIALLYLVTCCLLGRFLSTFPGRCILLSDLSFLSRNKVKQNHLRHLILLRISTQQLNSSTSVDTYSLHSGRYKNYTFSLIPLQGGPVPVWAGISIDNQTDLIVLPGNVTANV